MRTCLLILCLISETYALGTTTYEKYTEAPKGTTAETTRVVEATTEQNPTTCSMAMQEQVDYLLSQVEFLTSENEKQNDQISELQSEVGDLQAEVERISDSPVLKEGQRSCEDIRLSGVTESGIQTIDIDGPEGNMLPFEVYCDFTTDPATTLIGHDSENQTVVNGCQDPGCFSHEVTYDITMDQLVSVLSNSDTCRQYVKYECLASMMFEYYDYVWWVSRDGENQYYWGGAPPGSKMCACGVNNTCAGKSKTCNCDNNDEQWREDDGYLTAKDSLPVTALYFGDVFGLMERGIFTLGKLECQGRAKDRDCKTLKLNGHSSGYYEINPDPNNLLEPFTVYCDMDSYPGTGITVISHNVDGQVGPINSYYSNTYHFDVEYSNATIKEITAIIDISEHCRQYIEWQCYRTGMLSNTITSWESRDGEIMKYWGGADPSHDNYCACGETGSCEPNGNYQYKCNCDHTGSSDTRVDGGFLYDKTTLPVTALNFGLYYSGTSSYYGYYKLGDLQCY